MPFIRRGIADTLTGKFDPRFDPRKKELEKLLGLETEIVSRGTQDVPSIQLSDLEGMPFVTSMSDRTAAGGELVRINDTILARPVDLRGGQGFMHENPGLVWASAKSPVSNIMNRAAEMKAQTGIDPIFIPWRMAPTGGDFSTMTGEAMLAFASSAMGKGAKRSLNARIKKKIPDWAGVDDPASVEQWRNAPDAVRKELKNLMDTQFRGAGGLSIGEARLAVADPKQIDAMEGGIQEVGRIFADEDVVPSDHPSYPFGVPGEGLGRIVDEVGIYELLPEKAAERGIADPLNPSAQDMRAMQMGAQTGVINETILKRLADRGVNVGGLAAAAVVGGGLLVAPADEANAAALKGLFTPKQSLTDTLSGYSDEALRMLQKSALDEGKADEAARYARELDQRGSVGKPRLDPKAPVAAGATALAAQSEEAEAAPMGTLADGIKMATRQAYHGSPHDFDKFSLAKIGTGEGAQVYGHGLYFSDSEDIARYYRDALSKQTYGGVEVGALGEDGFDIGQALYELKGKPKTKAEFDRKIKRLIERAGKDVAENSKYGLSDAYANARLRGLRKLEYDKIDSPGKLYTVEIPDESLMLDWDKPLSEQPESVRDVIADILPLRRVEPDPGGEGYRLVQSNKPHMGLVYSESKSQLQRDADKFNAAQWARSGEDFYRQSVSSNSRDASSRLRELGIPGITYKGATSDERNFVVFDDEHINLIQKGLVDPKLLAPMAAGAATIGYATSEFAAAESSLNATEDDLRASSERFKALRKGKRAQRLSQELERVLAPVAGPAKALMDATEVMLVGVAGGIPGYLSELTGYVRGQDLEEAKAGGEALAGKLTGTMAEALGEDWDPQNPYLQGLAKAMEQGEKEFQDAYRMLGVENSVMKKGWDQLPERAQRIITGLADLAL